MDARVWKPRRFSAGTSCFAAHVTAAQARAERQALKAVLAKTDDRLLTDCGLTRAAAHVVLQQAGRPNRLRQTAAGRWRNRQSRGAACS